VQFDTTINEWHTCPESGRINASNPCSEYMFLDNTACNLASINLLKLYDADHRTFDVASYEHAIRLWTVVLEVSVLMAQYPSREIARLSHEYRTLGLGYANLGALLMQAGIPYHSELGRNIGGALASTLTGQSYAASAEMAAEHGPFPGYYKNKDHMLRVIRNHRRAAYGVPRDRDTAANHDLGFYEGLEISPVPINHETLTSGASIDNANDLLESAQRAWDEALNLGVQSGYRNAQTTVIAPTGTIGLLMDCDTTGVEPDFALVKFKKLAGGGYFKIANQSLRPALKSLGYSEDESRDVLTYVMGALSLEVPLPDDEGSIDGADSTFADLLKEKGLTDDAFAALNESLAGAMEIGFVFNAFTLGDDAVEAMGLTGQDDLLAALGLNRKQIDTLNELICGTGTVEGAPHLAEEHYAVFDCANKCGKKGERFIAPIGHIEMMGAVQPFISGAISKTINLPSDATVDDIKDAYRTSWGLGLKANALYRDGCKLSQPLNATTDDDVEDEEGIEAAREEIAQQVADAASQPHTVEKIVERIVERPMRRRLSNTRQSVTHKFNVAGHEGYLTVGLYEDGNPGELFITMAKEGSTIGGIMDSLGTAISVALQYGVPIESLVNKFSHQRFEPAGMTDNRDIPFAKSLVDYIFRWMGMEFIPGYRAANAPQRPSDKKAKPPAENGAKPKAMVAPKPAKPKADAPTHGGRLAESGDDTKNASATPEIKVVANDPPRLAVDDPSLGAERKTGSGGNGDTGGSGGSGGGSDANPISKLEAKTQAALATADRQNTAVQALTSTLNEANSQMMGDAPACDTCGSITVRNGTCYRCLNCGNSMGCS
ncbi:MAG: TSCPD domain-containing protein, partial [Planctomycetota bacterium]|jgi:ribonucleoside-diphosphate reductase alpha chain